MQGQWELSKACFDPLLSGDKEEEDVSAITGHNATSKPAAVTLTSSDTNSERLQELRHTPLLTA